MFRARVIGWLLFLTTLLAYLPATRNDFVNYDDDSYVTANPIVQRGLTVAGIKWAFTTSYFSNWHPLTWLSHMADCELFRLNPGGHHLVNVLFHAANTVLLFILMRQLTAALWPSAFIAALFAWHPLHVESVAWISERKDVLSTCFGLLALLSYDLHVKEKKRRAYYYGISLGCFAFGLMSKPMLVTLPFVMMLLDYWPLQRIKKENVPRLILEKLPFLLLTLISCVVTFLVQRNEAVASLQKVPLELRFENTITAYASYLLKTFWPVDLAVFYPLPRQISGFHLIAAFIVLFAISAVACRYYRSKPYLLVGWLWYLGTLVPVIGLVQVGDQALADRYTYFPLIGIFLAVTFAAKDLAQRFQLSNHLLAGSAGLILTVCLIVTEKQLSYWRDSQTLFTHALAVTGNNALARLNLGEAFQDQHLPDKALAEYREVLRLDPSRHEAYNNIARLLTDEGKPAEALGYSQAAVQLDPKSPSLHRSLGIILSQLGHDDEAMSQFAEATRLDGNYAPAHFQMGRTLLKLGHDDEAVSEFRLALRLEPDNLEVLIYTARVLASDKNLQSRDGAEALEFASRASQIAGDKQPVALDTLAMAYAESGRFEEAVETERQAVKFALAAGQHDDAAAMQKRLQLYQNHQPWRESFAK